MTHQQGAQGGRRPRSDHGQDLPGLLGSGGPTSSNLPALRRQPRRARWQPGHRGECGGPGGPQHRGGRAPVDAGGTGGAVRLDHRPVGRLADPTRRDPFIDDTGREALNFGISIAIYGLVALVAALMLVGIPLLIVGVIAWVVLASLAAVKASQGQAYRYPLTLRLVR
jgi:hypothetical protein